MLVILDTNVTAPKAAERINSIYKTLPTNRTEDRNKLNDQSAPCCLYSLHAPCG